MTWWYFDLVHTERIHSRLGEAADSAPTRLLEHWAVHLQELHGQSADLVIVGSTLAADEIRATKVTKPGPQDPSHTQNYAHDFVGSPRTPLLFSMSFNTFPYLSCLLMPFRFHVFPNWTSTEMDRCLQCWEDGHVDALLDVRNLLLCQHKLIDSKMDIARKICNVECSAMFRILLDRLSEQIYHAVKPSDQTLSCEMSVSAEGNHQICNAWPSLHNSLT